MSKRDKQTWNGPGQLLYSSFSFSVFRNNGRHGSLATHPLPLDPPPLTFFPCTYVGNKILMLSIMNPKDVIGCSKGRPRQLNIHLLSMLSNRKMMFRMLSRTLHGVCYHHRDKWGLIESTNHNILQTVCKLSCAQSDIMCMLCCQYHLVKFHRRWGNKQFLWYVFDVIFNITLGNQDHCSCPDVKSASDRMDSDIFCKK